MKGLVIKSPWIEYILQSTKTWEIRGRHTAVRERIALIKSQSGCIFGTCRVVDCVGPLTLEQLRQNADRHRIPLEGLEAGLPYDKTYAWVLADAKPLAQPIPYRHPSGAVIWVTLTPDRVPGRFDELDALCRQA